MFTFKRKRKLASIASPGDLPLDARVGSDSSETQVAKKCEPQHRPSRAFHRDQYRVLVAGVARALRHNRLHGRQLSLLLPLRGVRAKFRFQVCQYSSGMSLAEAYPIDLVRAFEVAFSAPGPSVAQFRKLSDD